MSTDIVNNNFVGAVAGDYPNFQSNLPTDLWIYHDLFVKQDRPRIPAQVKINVDALLGVGDGQRCVFRSPTREVECEVRR